MAPGRQSKANQHIMTGGDSAMDSAGLLSGLAQTGPRDRLALTMAGPKTQPVGP
jgi:hypothetical protein